MKAIPQERVLDYFTDLHNADLLHDRFADSELADGPTIQDTLGLVDSPTNFAVVDIVSKEIVAEFMLSNFVGKAAQIHFSLQPGLSFVEKVEIGTEVTNQILLNWKDVSRLPESYIDTLYGLSPVTNRPSCIYVRKLGFERLGILPNSAAYKGSIVDSLVTTKVASNG